MVRRKVQMLALKPRSRSFQNNFLMSRKYYVLMPGRAIPCRRILQREHWPLGYGGASNVSIVQSGSITLFMAISPRSPAKFGPAGAAAN